MAEFHKFIGFTVVGLFAIGWLWGLGAWIARRGPGDLYWRWLVGAQIVALLQALVGVTLLIVGRRPLTWLHLVYGFGPLLILSVAHLLAREQAFARRPWAAFALGSFICFGLSLRALMTGLGHG